jgi:hypothetical protein
MTKPPDVIATDSLEPDDGDVFDTPKIDVDANHQIHVRWPLERPPLYVQMSTPLFEEWVAMMNAARRLNDLLLNVVSLQHHEHADGSPGRVPAEMTHEIDRLKEMLRIP